MTEPSVVMPSYAKQAYAHYTRMRMTASGRDGMIDTIRAVRKGNIRQLFPEELNFSVSFAGTPVANFIDIVAHDAAEGIAPLPALQCVSGKMATQADKARAEIKNHIGNAYWLWSKLAPNMYRAADQFVSTGFAVFTVEPDTDYMRPCIRVEQSRGSYYELDRYGRCKVLANRYLKTVDALCAQFPEYEYLIRKPQKPNDPQPSGDTQLELIRYMDKKSVMLFLPERDGLVLSSYDHKLDRTPAYVAERPGFSERPRGQFDDVVWVQVARAIMSMLSLEAASLAVQAPIAVPDDMDEFPVGPHAALQSSQAKDIHRVNLELPNGIFAEGQLLDQELRVGSRYPDARTGDLQASVITGKGVEALLGTFDSQIRSAQMILQEALEELTSVCFEMDEKWWPNETKTVRGTTAGGSYEFEYTPGKTINGRYDCTVTYGFATGLKPSQSIIVLLQLAGAGMLAKGTAMENLPIDLDPIQESRRIDVEASREALKQGLFALVQSSGQVAASGGDALSIIKLGVDTIRSIENGQTVEDAIEGAYQAQQQEQQQKAQEAAQAQQDQAAQGGQGGAPGGDGLPPGVAPGQAGLPPGGLPTVENLVAGFRGNGSLPVSQATIQRRVPTGAA